MPQSDIYDALVYVATKPNFNVNVYISLDWYGHTQSDPNGAVYTYKDSTGVAYDGITVTPGVIPSITNPTVSGVATEGSVFINSALASSFQRLAFVTAHELLGHMYKFLKNDLYLHGNQTADAWILKIEREATKNWKLIKKWKKSKDVCATNLVN